MLSWRCLCRALNTSELSGNTWKATPPLPLGDLTPSVASNLHSPSTSSPQRPWYPDNQGLQSPFVSALQDLADVLVNIKCVSHLCLRQNERKEKRLDKNGEKKWPSSANCTFLGNLVDFSNHPLSPMSIGRANI